ncbi:MAG: 3',5'-nucleoside bisphosphate phosphatase [Rubrivivax sp.]|jgi:predicted metal-dependent phosphoesterase TrpH
MPGVHLINADLHSHSNVSDGTLTPEAVAARAQAHGVELWALTDHDELGGQARAREAALDLGLGWLSGTEISVSFAGETVHIVGLGFDIDHPGLVDGLAAVRGGRLQRARLMAEGLAKVGIPGAFEGALRYVGNPDLISRTHFGRFLVDSGVCADQHEVFRKYLTTGKPGYVPHQWARLGDAVRWVRGAGGIAVIAHPARYRFTPTVEYALITEFIAHGGRGLEVMTGSHSAPEQVQYADTAVEFDLLASRGSDFHAPGESRVEPGTLPDLPGQLNPVWVALQDRIHWPAGRAPAR